MTLTRILSFRWPVWAIVVATGVMGSLAAASPALHRLGVTWAATHFPSSWSWSPTALLAAGGIFLAVSTALLFFFLMKLQGETPGRERLVFLLPVFAATVLVAAPFASDGNGASGAQALEHLRHLRLEGHPWNDEARVLQAIVQHDTAALRRFNVQAGKH